MIPRQQQKKKKKKNKGATKYGSTMLQKCHMEGNLNYWKVAATCINFDKHIKHHIYYLYFFYFKFKIDISAALIVTLAVISANGNI